MIKKILLKWFIKYYVDANRDIVKIIPEEEMNLFLLKSPDKTIRLYQSLLTLYTVKYWDADSDEERWILKGMSTMLKILKDGYFTAKELEKLSDKDEAQKRWLGYKFFDRRFKK